MTTRRITFEVDDEGDLYEIVALGEPTILLTTMPVPLEFITLEWIVRESRGYETVLVKTTKQGDTMSRHGTGEVQVTAEFATTKLLLMYPDIKSTPRIRVLVRHAILWGYRIGTERTRSRLRPKG